MRATSDDLLRTRRYADDDINGSRACAPGRQA